MSRIGKIELIDKIAEKARMPKSDTTAVINAFIQEIQEEMEKENDVVIPDFGSFKIQTIKAKKGRNIRTGEPVNIPEHKKIKFTAGKALDNTINNKK